MKVNVGCGLGVAPGWINLDGSTLALLPPSPRAVLRVLYRVTPAGRYLTCDEFVERLKGGTFVCHNLEYGLSFVDGTVDFLYSSHVLDELSLRNVKHLLKEGFRVLKKGGTFRICVGDLEQTVQLYLKGEKEKFLGFFFKDSSYIPYFSLRRSRFDFGMLENVLKEAGFSHVQRCEYRQGRTPDIEVLDNRPKETLFVEAVK